MPIILDHQLREQITCCFFNFLHGRRGNALLFFPHPAHRQMDNREQ